MTPRAGSGTDRPRAARGRATPMWRCCADFARRPEQGLRLTLVAREPHTPYSGMLPGLVRGDYGFDQAHIDLAPLAAVSGARLLMAEADGIDLAARLVSIAGRPPIGFDLLSLDVGGLPQMPPDANGIPVKPIGQFLDRLAALQSALERGARIAVVGAGPAGTELSLALARRFGGARPDRARRGGTPEPLPTAPDRARTLARAALAEAGVELVCGVQAGALHDGRLLLSDGSALDIEPALWATGVVGPELPCRSRARLRRGGLRARRSRLAQRQPFVRLRRRRLRVRRGRGAAEGGGVGGARRRAARREPAPCRLRPGGAPLAAAKGGAHHPRDRQRGAHRLAQRPYRRRAADLALEGLDRPALDANVRDADEAAPGRSCGGHALRRLRCQGGRGRSRRDARRAEPEPASGRPDRGCRRRRRGRDAATARPGTGAERRLLPRLPG